MPEQVCLIVYRCELVDVDRGERRFFDARGRGRDPVSAHQADKRVCLMRGHGITTAAPSVEEAALAAIHINELATINYQAYLLGHPRPISREDQAAFRTLERAPVSHDGEPPTGRPGALWRYYCELTEA